MARKLLPVDEQLLDMIQAQRHELVKHIRESSPELDAEQVTGRERLRERHLEEMDPQDAAAVIAASLFATSIALSQVFEDQPEEALARLRSACLLTAAELADLRDELAAETEKQREVRWANRGGYL